MTINGDHWLGRFVCATKEFLCFEHWRRSKQKTVKVANQMDNREHETENGIPRQQEEQNMTENSDIDDDESASDSDDDRTQKVNRVQILPCRQPFNHLS